MKTLASALAAVALSLALSTPAYAAARDGDKTRGYAEGVSLLNLLNGLNLSTEQLQRTLELNKELKALRDGALETPEAQALEAEKEKALGALYAYLLDNPEKEDKEIQARAAKAEHAVKAFRDEAFKKLGPEFDRIAKEVEALLSSQQLAVVEDFAPCVVPPKDMRDPVRAGQAKSSDAGVKALEQARQLAAAKKDVDEFAKKAADRVVEASERKAKLEDAERQELRSRVVDAIKQAVKLSPTDFEIQKPLLAQKLEPVNRIDELRGEIKQRDPHANPMLNAKNPKVVQFLVNPDVVVPVLEKRLRVSSPGGLKGAGGTGKSAAASSSQPPPGAKGAWK